MKYFIIFGFSFYSIMYYLYVSTPLVIFNLKLKDYLLGLNEKSAHVNTTHTRPGLSTRVVYHDACACNR